MENASISETHLLRNNYRFWRTLEADNNTAEYENALQDLGLCTSVEEFWKIYCSLPVIGSERASNYYLFKDGIEPLWEDPQNRDGGRISVVLTGTELAPYLWETLLLTAIGEQFNVGKEICGVSVSIKKSNTILYVWNMTASLNRVIGQIESVLKTVWNAPSHMRFMYKRNKVAVESVARYIKVEQTDVKKPIETSSGNRFAELFADNDE